MNKNVMIVLAGGFVIAILVAVLVQASIGGSKSPEEGPKTEVLVAAKNLSVGTELKDGDLKWQVWPGSPFSGAIVRKDDQPASEALTGRIVQSVAQAQPVLSSYIFKEGKGNIVAAALQKGMRAMAIPVKAETMAGGFISPGDRVDVILTHTLNMDGVERDDSAAYINTRSSETIMTNLKVIGVDQESEREEDKAKVARTVTLEVDAKGAETLALSAQMGDLTLALRGIGDDTTDAVNGVTTDVEVSHVMQNVVRMQNGAGSAVRVYSGGTMTEQRPRANGQINFSGNAGIKTEQQQEGLKAQSMEGAQ